MEWTNLIEQASEKYKSLCKGGTWKDKDMHKQQIVALIAALKKVVKFKPKSPHPEKGKTPHPHSGPPKPKEKEKYDTGKGGTLNGKLPPLRGERHMKK